MLLYPRPRWLACVIFLLWPIAQAHAEGAIVITQAQALAGNITPDDTPGFPITLARPGSYEFASNLKVPANKNGISITAHDVTIDLKGFRIYGSNVASYGITGGTNSTTVRNGTVALFRADGIRLTGDFAIVEHMRVVVNSGTGIHLGESGLLQDNIVSGNSTGLYALNSLIQGNVVTQNKVEGIVAVQSSVVGNNITSNQGVGILNPGGGGSFVGYGNNTLFGNNGGGSQPVSSA